MNKHKIHVLYMYMYNIWRNNYLYDNVLIIADDFPMNNIQYITPYSNSNYLISIVSNYCLTTVMLN